MGGALAERVFAHKIEKVGFTDITVHGRQRMGIDEIERYPLFTQELMSLMRELLPPGQHDEVATAITLTAHRPGEGEVAG